jgi:hypothetical protein
MGVNYINLSISAYNELLPMGWEYTSVTITLQRSGEFQLQDLEQHKQVLTDNGWEYIGMRALAQKQEDVAEVVLRFRRRAVKPPTKELT